jgi:N-acyl-D-amino-acid deacylase
MAVADGIRHSEEVSVLMSSAKSCARYSWRASWIRGSLLGAALLSSAIAGAAQVDLLIRGGTLVDGTGAPGRVADVAISGSRIVEVGTDLKSRARRVVDARGKVVAPGFIDMHNHSDGALVSSDGFLNDAFVRQGVTTVVLGPDGGHSPSSMQELLRNLRTRGAGTNVAFYVGHNRIRTEVLASDQNRAPSAAELAKMQGLVREGMELGAVGLSTGLMYSPGLFSQTDEVVALAKQVAPFGGVYETHVRDPHRGLLQSGWEAIEIGRQARVPVDLTHLTTPGKNNRGLMRAVIELVEDARREGIEVVADQYPYPAVATLQLWGVLNYPADLGLETSDEIRAALRDPGKRARIREETLSGSTSGFSHYKASGPDSILVLSSPDLPGYEGRFISEIAAERGVDGFDAVAFLLESSRSDIVASMGGFYEEDMRLLMRRPWAMIASDGFVRMAGSGGAKYLSSHPRSTGTFPRVLGKYVREEGVLTLEEAVRKATSAPAEFLKLPERGKIIAGHAADLTIFDPQSISDRSTWKEPDAPPVGIEAVLVNGQFALRDGKLTGMAAGHFVRRGAPSLQLKLQPGE